MDNESMQLEPRKNAKVTVKADERGLKFTDLDQMWRFSVACASSREFKDIQTPEQALIRLQAGLELGLGPIWSLTNVMVVNGRPSVWGDAALGICQAHKDFENIIETMEYPQEFQKEPKDRDYLGLTAHCEVQRRGRAPVKGSFSIEDAKKAGLWDKSGPWKQYPKRMLQMRARAFALRDAFADALRGLSLVEEIRDIEPSTPREPVTEMVLPDEVK